MPKHSQRVLIACDRLLEEAGLVFAAPHLAVVDKEQLLLSELQARQQFLFAVRLGPSSIGLWDNFCWLYSNVKLTSITNLYPVGLLESSIIGYVFALSLNAVRLAKII